MNQIPHSENLKIKYELSKKENISSLSMLEGTFTVSIDSRNLLEEKGVYLRQTAFNMKDAKEQLENHPGKGERISAWVEAKNVSLIFAPQDPDTVEIRVVKRDEEEPIEKEKIALDEITSELTDSLDRFVEHIENRAYDDIENFHLDALRSSSKSTGNTGKEEINISTDRSGPLKRIKAFMEKLRQGKFRRSV